jgi:hypothetical protein
MLVTQPLKADQLLADAEVKAAEKLLMAAELQHALAQQERARLNAEISQARKVDYCPLN